MDAVVNPNEADDDLELEMGSRSPHVAFGKRTKRGAHRWMRVCLLVLGAACSICSLALALYMWRQNAVPGATTAVPAAPTELAVARGVVATTVAAAAVGDAVSAAPQPPAGPARA